MSISHQHIEHIARLARIALSDEEKSAFAGDLSAILEFVEKLKTAHTADVPPMTGGTTLANMEREDTDAPDSNSDSKTLIAAAPETERGYVKVKEIFNRHCEERNGV